MFNNMSSRRAPGVDGSPMEIFKQSPEYFIDIFNFCFCNGHFPACWKIAKKFLCPKFSKDLSLVDSYRPISLLPAWGKLLDKIITSRLDYFLELNNYYHRLKFGFRKKKSTSLAMHSILDFIEDGRFQNMISLMSVLDIKGAFNNAVWSHIRLKLPIPKYLTAITNSFICNRSVECECNHVQHERSSGFLSGSQAVANPHQGDPHQPKKFLGSSFC